MTRARRIQAGASYLITRRVSQRRYGLRPDEEAVQIYEYLLAEAAERFRVALGAWTMMSNHHHLVVQDVAGTLPQFNTRLHWLMSRAMGAHRGWVENFWSNHPVNVVRLVEPHDAFARLVYVVANPIRARLVEAATDWRGASSFSQNIGFGPKTIERPRFFRADGATPERVVLQAARLDGFQHLSASDWSRKVGAAVADAEDTARKERARDGARVRGMGAVLADSPEDSPSTPVLRGGRTPELACTDRERRRVELQDLRSFQLEHRDAWRALHEGERDVMFPTGSSTMHALAKKPAGDD